MSDKPTDFSETELNARQEAVDAPQLTPTMPNCKATIGLLVNDQPGVLVRVAQVFTRRGYNIENLVVSQAHIRNSSRMTITCVGYPSWPSGQKRTIPLGLLPVAAHSTRRPVR